MTEYRENTVARARLSQRAGRALAILVGELDVQQAFRNAVVAADSFETLDPWAQAVILDFEETVATLGDEDYQFVPMSEQPASP